MTSICDICCETFNNSTHLKVECKGYGCLDGDKFACRTCCKTYILNSQNDPQCIFCKCPWDRDFMNKYLTKSFVNGDLKKHSENLFLERQVSLLPETQKRAVQLKLARELLQKKNEVMSEIKNLKDQLRELTNVSYAYNLEISRLQGGTSTNDISAKENFTFKCKGECNGFLNSKHYCDLCDTQYCKECMEVKQGGHICDTETKESVSKILKSSKPCPGCGEMISKIDGCDQMWCIKCHVQFSWTTGFQIKGHNHNPEYFRWLRETNQPIDRNPNEVIPGCGFIMDEYSLLYNLRIIFPISKVWIDYFMSVYRFYRHVEMIVQQTVRENAMFEYDLLNLRIKYILGDFSKEKWKIYLQRLDKKNKIKTDYNNIWRLTETGILSFLEKLKILLETTNTLQKYVSLRDDINKFKEYINASFINISNVYGSSTCPGIDDDWMQNHNFKVYILTKK